MPDQLRDEAEAREELQRITPRNADLLKLADRFPAPQEWYDEDIVECAANTTNDHVHAEVAE